MGERIAVNSRYAKVRSLQYVCIVSILSKPQDQRFRRNSQEFKLLSHLRRNAERASVNSPLKKGVLVLLSLLSSADNGSEARTILKNMYFHFLFFSS